jgi:peptidoglycan/xylan/chitin deacetylase (PgdA/CDA1 family)
MGIRAIFFLIPSLVGRTVQEWLRHHERAGVKAVPPAGLRDRAGLSIVQVREMLAMGHRIAAHNQAHRDLSFLHDPESIRFEVQGALDAIGEITDAPCRDFALAFGQPENLSDEAAAYLREQCPRVYACHRGLNVPGKTPRFLLRHAPEPWHPLEFTRLCLEGGADHRLADRCREMVRRVGTLPQARAARVSFAAMQPPAA